MTADFRELRVNMVDTQIRTRDVTDISVIDSFLAVPREEFVPEERRALAYIDEDLMLVEAMPGQDARYLMQPSPSAKLIQLANIQPNNVVLDVGCATGYTSAVISALAGPVIALESETTLAEQATLNLQALGCDNVVVVTGPLTQGYASEAPYDVIIIEGAVDFVPQALQDQLKNGGRLVAVLGRGNTGLARLFVKEDDIVSSRGIFNIALKPLPGFQKEAEFVF